MTNYKQLCAELVDDLELCDWPYKLKGTIRADIARARATLANPEPEGPTDEELLQVFDIVCLSEGGTVDEIHLRGLRAVLARWGNHPGSPDSSLQPVPVSERLPEPVPLSERPWEREEWCDEQGRCWWFDSADPGWVFDTPETCQHWSSFVLPAHALPLPTHD